MTDDVLDIDNITPVLQTNRFNRYQELVETWAGSDQESEEEEVDEDDSDTDTDDEEEEKEQELGIPFEDGYELFTAGLVIGYTRDQEHGTTGSRELVHYSRIEGSAHGSCIRMIFSLVTAENRDEFEDEHEVWNKLIRYSDWGVNHLYRHRDREERIELVELIDEMNDLWEDRVQAAIENVQEEQDADVGDITWES